MHSCQAAQQCEIAEVNIYDSYKFNNVQASVYLFLQSSCVTAQLGKIQVLDKLPGRQWAKSDATLQADTFGRLFSDTCWQYIFPEHSLSLFYFSWKVQWRSPGCRKRKKSKFTPFVLSGPGTCISRLSHQDNFPSRKLLFTYCTSQFISVQMASVS